jgi:hypothetical protein
MESKSSSLVRTFQVLHFAQGKVILPVYVAMVEIDPCYNIFNNLIILKT